jgi:hypothetical protein
MDEQWNEARKRLIGYFAGWDMELDFPIGGAHGAPYGLDPEKLLAQAETLLDRAAGAARRGDLADAARALLEFRDESVKQRLFVRHDNAIVFFLEIVTLVRRMAPDASVPAEFQRLIDAKPSLLGDLTRNQRKFWYG